MATTESRSDAGSIDESELEEADPNNRTVRALTEVMTVLDSIGRARNADDLFLVNSGSGSEYLVDTRTGSCECKWKQYNPGKECKHQKRVAFATGERPIPQWVDDDALDDQFGLHVDGDPRKAVADGGVIDETHTVSGGNQTTLYADIPAAQGAEGTVSTSPSEASTLPLEDSTRNESNSSGDKDSTDSNSDGSGPGFGVGSALASLGGAGYLLKRRLTTDDSADDET
jgi:PGF-CTERM protein